MYWRLGCAALAIGCAGLALTCPACGRMQFDPLVDGDAEPSCDIAAPFGAPVVLANVSDPTEHDGTLRLMPDELTGYFWSRRGTGISQIYLAQRPDRVTPFTVSPVGGLDSGVNLIDPSITADGSVMVLRHSGPGDDLYVATRTSADTFVGTTAIGVLNTASVEAQCFLPLGRDEIYFESTRTGTGDIYTATRTGTTFGSPMLLASLATSSDEGDPVVTPDGLTIYFRSDRPSAHAGYNIYMATRPDLGDTFGPATEVPNVNTFADDGPSWISPDGCRLYISSTIAGTTDIYVATRGE